MIARQLNLFMDIADRAAEMSRAVRLKVGAVIVHDGRILSMSWNGTPTGWPNECEDEIAVTDTNNNITYQLVTKPEVIHAESNCILKLARSRESGEGATMFITHSPCMDCAKMIYQAGIKTVYYRYRFIPPGGPDKSEPGIAFLQKCSVKIEQLSNNNEHPTGELHE